MSHGGIYPKQFSDIKFEVLRTGKWNGKNAHFYHILGRRAGFTSTTILNDIKEFDNGVATIPELSNSTLDILSSSTNDTNTAGVGARKVKVTYIDNSNNLVQSANINLNGTTLVTSVLTGVNEVLWMEVTEVGVSGGVSAGNIRLRINGTTQEVEQISTGGNKSLSARFMIPIGYTGFIYDFSVSAIGNDQDTRLRALVNSYDNSLSTVYHFIDEKYVAGGAISPATGLLTKIPALSKVKVSTLSNATASANRCNANFYVLLIED